MKARINISDSDVGALRQLYREAIRRSPGIDRESLYAAVFNPYKEFAREHPELSARALFDSVDDIETRAESLEEISQGVWDFRDGTIMALNKTRIVKEDMNADHWRQKRQQIHDNQARTNAAADRAIEICDRHIDELLGGKAA